MPRETLTISMPPKMIVWIRKRAESSGHASVSAYLRGLVVEEAKRQRSIAATRRAIEAARQRQREADAKVFRRHGSIRRGQSRNPRVK